MNLKNLGAISKRAAELNAAQRKVLAAMIEDRTPGDVAQTFVFALKKAEDLSDEERALLVKDLTKE